MKSLLALALLMLALPASAHPLAPALLELRETTPAQDEMLWRTSATRAPRVDVQPLLPEDCRQSVPAPAELEDRDSLVLRSTLDCAPQGLAGHELRIAGLAQASINVIVRVLPLEGAPVRGFDQHMVRAQLDQTFGFTVTFSFMQREHFLAHHDVAADDPVEGTAGEQFFGLPGRIARAAARVAARKPQRRLNLKKVRNVFDANGKLDDVNRHGRNKARAKP